MMNKSDSEIMEELQGKIRELAEEKRRLHKKLEEKESKINELQEENSKQKEELQELKEENQKLRQEIFGLKTSKKRIRSSHTDQKPKKRGPPFGHKGTSRKRPDRVDTTIVLNSKSALTAWGAQRIEGCEGEI
jgi:chromosome segregation ATPase